MKFFIDTANLEQIKEAQSLGVLDGVTTNPSLMAKEGITGHQNILQHYIDICSLVDGDVSAEVIATEYQAMIKEGEALAKLHEQIVVKIPMIKDGIKAIKYFSDQRHKNQLYFGILIWAGFTWLQRQVQLMSLLLLEDLMIYLQMGLI